jgi:hypothetical protein
MRLGSAVGSIVAGGDEFVDGGGACVGGGVCGVLEGDAVEAEGLGSANGTGEGGETGVWVDDGPVDMVVKAGSGRS